MPTISNVRRPIHPPALEFPVAMKAQCNDPHQKVKLNGRAVSISGEAWNNGIIASHARFTIKGKEYSVPLSRGMSPMQTVKALQKQLPPDLHVQILSTPRPGDGVNFQVMQGAAAPVKPSSVEKINEAFAKAQTPGTPSGSKVGVSELRKAFAVATDDGRFSKAEKDALAKNWASLFTGAGFNATAAAQKEYAKLQAKFDLPVYPVR